jgi:hypothetical protein
MSPSRLLYLLREGYETQTLSIASVLAETLGFLLLKLLTVPVHASTRPES